MQLQTTPRLKQQRSMRMGAPLGQIQAQSNVSASADNAAAGNRQQNWNQAAAQQYSQMKQQQNAVDVGTINTEANRQVLAKALGYDPSNSPQFGQLYAKFLSLPKSVQTGIYQKGGAPFLNDENETGMKDLSAVSDKLDALHTQHTSDVVQGVIKGDVGYDIDPKTNQPSWWVKRTIPNPADPSGKAGLPPIEVHEPANPIIKAYLARAVNQGIMPDPVTGKLADTNNPPTPGQRPTEEQFQQTLNQRANQPDDTDRFQQVLNQRIGQQQGQLASQMDSDIPSEFNQPNSPPSTNLVTQPQLTPASSAALLARSKLSNILGTNSESTAGSDALDALGQTYGHDVPQAIGNAYDYVNTFLGGHPSTPTPDLSTQPVPATPLSPVDAALQAAQMKQQQQIQPSPQFQTSDDWGMN